MWALWGKGLIYDVYADFELPWHFTVHGARVRADEGRRILEVDFEAQVLAHVKGRPFTPYLLELCAGMGAMGLGPMHLGAIPLVRIDSNKLVEAHLKRNQHGTVVCASVGDPVARYEIHSKIRDHPVAVLVGVPCQPYSVQGKGLEMMEPRAQTLKGVMDFCHLIQPQAIVMECEESFGACKGAQDLIDSFLTMWGWHKKSVIPT